MTKPDASHEAVSLKGPALVLIAALLFGASSPLVKVILRNVHPLMLSGILYLGSGLGLSALADSGRKPPKLR